LPSIIEYRMNRSMQNMIKNCNRVIIPDDGDENGNKNMDNISYVGPIVRELTTTDRAALRKRFGMNRQTILVSIGGTVAGRYLIEMTIKAFEKLKRKLDIDLIIASGPSLSTIMLEI
jgi:UDP-N-acetylglucosamine--N-acetylmuramyl-(pentapeptide) pyrophosphoryl-undecaprenol N-acetylglucosamine transferase